MIDNKSIAVVMPAYNAEKTLKKTVDALPDIVDRIIVVDDYSSDKTAEVAKQMNLKYIRHDKNLGYGGNQKTCYKTALETDASYIIMVHPDYQYSPKLATAMTAMMHSGHYDIILASRIIGDQTSRRRKMPIWRYISNRFLTLCQNILLHQKLSEYHTGYRAFTREVLEKLDLENNSDDFAFDNEMLAQAVYHGFRIGEISCPTNYEPESSSINFMRSVKYGLAVLSISIQYRLTKWDLFHSKLFK